MNPEEIVKNAILSGPLLPEPISVVMVEPLGDSYKIMGKGMETGRFHDPVLSLEQIAQLSVSPGREPFDGESERFRLGIEAMRIGLAYEYDPYFSLSIARVDPLPHQLDAVYHYFLRQPRIRFLLADDPGAGKTIMAGLLLKELKIRGLVKRILIIAPANLCFQWQREMKDKFREQFKVMRSDVLRANYGLNPWQDEDQVVTSVSWVSRVDDARESLLRSHWDLVIVDEAHKMSAATRKNKTLAYQLGEALSQQTDHFLMMTATPHKGDPVHFCLFLELLDKDVYGDVKSLEEAMRRQSAPFYLRRTKEALVTFPDPDSGEVKKLFTKRDVQTVEFQIDDEERDFYDALTRYVEDQSIRASAEDSARARALTFTMAMLQRRFASSMYAVRRSLERMRDARQRILDDPQAHRERQKLKLCPDDFEDLPEDEQEQILHDLEEVVADVDPAALRQEIIELGKLIEHARALEDREIESKLTRLRETITEHGIFKDSKMKLLIFTEHKDTLDYLVGKLEEWGLVVTQIHGGMKIGDRDTPGSRIYAEREFRESAQILVATEAAGEGINLQFCWFMINYDIPWNPVRLEQRMGRIHRYGQEKDCLILNFVATNTREGRVLHKLMERLLQMRDDLGSDKVFDVIGEVFPSNLLERMIRDMYARNLREDVILDRIVTEIDADHIRRITENTLEGLAKKELNLSAIVGKSAEAKERRLVPEVIEQFFTEAAPVAGVKPTPNRAKPHVYRVGRLPRGLLTIGEKQENRYGKLGREYGDVVFDKEMLNRDPTWEWVTPGHPLFESMRESVLGQVQDDLRRGAVFYDLHHDKPYRLDVFSASIRDGRGSEIHRKLFVVQTGESGTAVRQPTIFLDLAHAPKGTAVADGLPMPDRSVLESTLHTEALVPLQKEVEAERRREVEVVSRHVDVSLTAIIDKVQVQAAKLFEQQASGSSESGLDGRIKQMEDRLDELNHRLESRRAELEQEQHCTIGDIQHIGAAWVLPHPDRMKPGIAPMVRNDEIERIAVEAVTKFEEARGWKVESVEKENRGFDLISRKPHPEDPETAIAVRFIEVKGRAAVGEVALTRNEYRTAERLKDDFWLYVVFNCGSEPQVHVIQNPVRLGWEPVVTVEHYHVGAEKILNVS